MADYSVPAEIRKFKPIGTMVKKINGKDYYVYEYKSVIENGKRKTKMGTMIGKIVEGKGFIPNNNFVNDDSLTTLDYGQYRVVLDNTKDIYSSLTDVFAYDDAARIYAMAVISYVNNFTYTKDYCKLFEQSYLSLEFNHIKMGYDSLSTLLEDLGRKGGKVVQFEDNLISSSSKEIAIDGHVIPCYSNDNDLSNPGYQFKKLNAEQINLLSGYDVNNHRPLFQRIFNGSLPDKVSVKDILDTKDLHDILFIVDRGFYSEENITMFSKDGNRYIIPLSPNLKSYKAVIKNVDLDKSFMYKNGGKKALIRYRESIVDNKRIIIFRDENQNSAECADYLDNLEQGKKGFNQEKYERLKEYFGLIVLQTNLENEAKEIYTKYKKRWSIETYYNFLKNRNDFKAVHGQDYYKMKGWSFILLIVGLIQSEMDKTAKKINGKGVYDILLEAKAVKISRTSKGWKIENQTKKTRELFDSLEHPLTPLVDWIYL